MITSKAMRVQLHHGVEAIGPQAWSALTRDSRLYASYPWLRSIEMFSQSPTPYLAAYDGTTPIAVVLLDTPDRETNALYDPAQLWPAEGPSAGQAVHLGLRRGYLNDVLLSSDSPVARQSLGALAAAAQDLGTGRAVVAQYVPVDQLPTARALLGTGTGVTLPVAFNAVIDLPGSTFEDYLEGFEPRARAKIRCERRRFQQAGYTVGCERLASGAEAGVDVDELAHLLGNVQERYGHRGDLPGLSRLIQTQVEQLAEHAVLFACRRSADGPLIAFALAYAFNGALYLRMAGFDYAALTDAFEYFNLGMYEPIEYAYAHGLRSVQLGIEGYQGKSRRQARLEPLVTLISTPAGTDDTRLRRSAWDRLGSLVAWDPRLMNVFDDLCTEPLAKGQYAR